MGWMTRVVSTGLALVGGGFAAEQAQLETLSFELAGQHEFVFEAALPSGARFVHAQHGGLQQGGCELHCAAIGSHLLSLVSSGAEREQVARRLFTRRPRYTVEIETVEALSLDRLHGFRIVGSAQPKEPGGQALALQSTFLFDSWSCWRIDALTALEQRARDLPVLERAGAGFRRKQRELLQDGVGLRVPYSWWARPELEADGWTVAHVDGGLSLFVDRAPREFRSATLEQWLDGWQPEDALSVSGPHADQVGGLRALRFEYTYGEPGEEYFCWNLCVEGERSFHDLCFYCAQEDAEWAVDEFRAIADSFRELPDSAHTEQPEPEELSPAQGRPSGEAVRVPGTAVRMSLPPGYAAVQTSYEFWDREYRASIAVVEYDSELDAADGHWTYEECLREQESPLEGCAPFAVGEPEFSFAGRPGMLFAYRDQRFSEHSWVGVFETPRGCVYVTASCPSELAARYERELRLALQSCEWDSSVQVDPLETLEFELGDQHGFDRIERSSLQSVVYSEAEVEWVEDLERCFEVTIGPDHADATEAAAREQALDTFRWHYGIPVDVGELEACHFDSMSGYRCTSRLTGSDGLRYTLYQVLLHDTGGYWYLVGKTRNELAEEDLQLFEEMTGSFSRRRTQHTWPTGLLRLEVPALWYEAPATPSSRLRGGLQLNSTFGPWLSLQSFDKADWESFDEFSADWSIHGVLLDKDAPETLPDIAGCRTVRYRVRMQESEGNFVYLVYRLEGPLYFHSLLLRCREEAFERARPGLEAIALSLR